MQHREIAERHAQAQPVFVHGFLEFLHPVKCGFDLRGDGQRERVGATFRLSSEALCLRLTIPLPLFQRNQGRIAEAESFTRQAKSRSNALALTVAAEIDAAFHRVEELRKAVDGYRAQVIPLVDKNVALAHEAYRSGLTSMVQVVQAQRQQSELRTGYLDVVAQYRQAMIDLEQAAATNPSLDKPEDEK